MKKMLLPAWLLLAALTTLQSQTNVPRILCGNEVFSHMLQEHHPQLQADFDATFDAAKAKAVTASPVQTRSTYTINVVVHVVWNEPEENLSDDLILDQIAVLNEDYSHTNADAGNLRAAFQDVAGSADIQFNLAQIVRVHTDQLFEVNLFGTNLLPEVKHTADGGSDAWDTEHYLNIWVCKVQPLGFGGIVLGQILGFAFPPTGLDNWPAGSSSPNADEDGVVIDYHAFSRNNPNPIDIPGTTDPLIVAGRTPVHEVGHYLGLRHIWGDGGLLGPNDCAQSDGIDDTPYASAQSNFDCDKTKNSCEQIEQYYSLDMPDLIENYMDYASEDCMNMFTQGQVALMRSVLEGPRAGLLEASATHAPGRLADWSLSPNPAGDQATVTLRTPSAVRVVVTDAQGRVVLEQEVAAGNQRVVLATRGLAGGLYFVRVETGKGVSARRLVVER